MQSKTFSLIESLTNVLFGYFLALLGQIILFPLVLGIDAPIKANLILGLCFTVLSIARSYILRRVFNGFKK